MLMRSQESVEPMTAVGIMRRLAWHGGSTNMSIPPTPAQSAALKDLGLTEGDITAFLEGKFVVYYLPTGSDPAIALIQKSGARLRSGIYVIRDPGGGVKTLARFRGQSRKVAKLFCLNELELFGVAVTNEKLETMLALSGV